MRGGAAPFHKITRQRLRDILRLATCHKLADVVVVVVVAGVVDDQQMTKFTNDGKNDGKKIRCV